MTLDELLFEEALLHGFDAETVSKCLEFARALVLPGRGEIGDAELSPVEESYVRQIFSEAFEADGEITRWLTQRN